MAYSLKLQIMIEKFKSDIRSVFFWAITHHVVAIPYGRSVTAHRYQIVGSRIHIGPKFEGQQHKNLGSWS
jgi:hypothetical protein